jgi:hypothetical protein
MTTRKRRQAERIKAYGLVLHRHRCGREIFVGADGQFFAAEAHADSDTQPGKTAIMVCPQCGRELDRPSLAVFEP